MSPPESRRRGVAVLLAVLLAATGVLLFVPPVAPDPKYHRFVDERPCLGIPSAWNVLSNAAFLVVGLFGLARRPRTAAAVMVLGGLLAVAAGSAYYHLAPDDDRLVADRLPVAVVFMALLAQVISDRVDERLRRRLLLPLVLLGAASAVHWRWAGDLRFYGIVQYGTALAILLLAAFCPSRVRGAAAIWAALGLYAAAKACELGDRAVYEMLGIGGHAFKHLFAAAAVGALIPLLTRGKGPEDSFFAPENASCGK